MKKLSKVFLAAIALVGFGLLVSCNTTSKPNDDEPPVLRKALDTIEVDTSSVKLEYYLGQTFESNGLKVQANYTNETSEDVSSSAVVNSENFDSTALGKYLIVVSYTYEGRVRTGSYTVEVKTILDNNVKHLIGLNVNIPQIGEGTEAKNKEYTYNVGEDFDVSDVTFEAVYSDDTTVSLAFDDVNKNFESIDKTTAGYYSAVFSKTESYTVSGITQEVTVKNFVIITYVNAITDLTFKSGTVEFDFGTEFTEGTPMTADWVFEATYANGDKVDIRYGQFVSSGNVNTNLSGESTVVVSYTEMGVTKRCNVTVTVKPDPNADQGLNAVLNANDLTPANPITEDIVVSYFTIKAESKMRIDGNQPTKTFGDLSFNTRININGSYSSERNIEITMPKAGTIRVIFSQGNAGRKMSLYKGGALIEEGTSETVDNATLVEQVFSVDEAGVYQIGCSVGGIYIWYIALGEPLEA